MLSARWIGGCVAVLMLCGLALPPAEVLAADVKIGEVSKRAFLGARGKRVDGKREDLYHRTPVYSDQEVTTGLRVDTTLRFLDRSKLQVGPTARIVLDKFVYDSGAKTGQRCLSVSHDRFYRLWISRICVEPSSAIRMNL